MRLSFESGCYEDGLSLTGKQAQISNSKEKTHWLQCDSLILKIGDHRRRVPYEWDESVLNKTRLPESFG